MLMNAQLKQRLVGAVVLLALAVIFLPLLLDGRPPLPPPVRVNIPPLPVMPQVPESQTTGSQRLEAARERLSQRQQQFYEGRNTASDEQLGWVVRVASFRQQDNAEALLQQLQAAQFKAYQLHYTRDGQPWWPVFVGPVPERKAADQLARQLKQQFNLSGVVHPYEPLAQ